MSILSHLKYCLLTLAYFKCMRLNELIQLFCALLFPLSHLNPPPPLSPQGDNIVKPLNLKSVTFIGSGLSADQVPHALAVRIEIGFHSCVLFFLLRCRADGLPVLVSLNALTVLLRHHIE